MFRASLRSASDPLREHVCLSCLTRRFGGNIRSRPFHTTFIRRNESGDGSAANGTAQSNEPPKSTPVPEVGMPVSFRYEERILTMVKEQKHTSRSEATQSGFEFEG